MSDDASRKEKRIERKSPCPHHDQPCQRIPYSDSKSLFEMLKNEANDG